MSGEVAKLEAYRESEIEGIVRALRRIPLDRFFAHSVAVSLVPEGHVVEIVPQRRPRGAPPGARVDDSRALALMDFVSDGDGINEAETLAKFVVKWAPDLLHKTTSTAESHVKRLAKAWKKRREDAKK